MQSRPVWKTTEAFGGMPFSTLGFCQSGSITSTYVDHFSHMDSRCPGASAKLRQKTRELKTSDLSQTPAIIQTTKTPQPPPHRQNCSPLHGTQKPQTAVHLGPHRDKKAQESRFRSVWNGAFAVIPSPSAGLSVAGDASPGSHQFAPIRGNSQ